VEKPNVFETEPYELLQELDDLCTSPFAKPADPDATLDGWAARDSFLAHEWEYREASDRCFMIAKKLEAVALPAVDDGPPASQPTLGPVPARARSKQHPRADAAEARVPVEEVEDDEEACQVPALVDTERLTLLTLQTFDPSKLASAQDVSDAMDPAERLSERTIRKAIRALIELDLAERPEGGRQGARLTTPGRRLASKIAG